MANPLLRALCQTAAPTRDIWAWRADHGNGVGWTDNVGDTGAVVNGDQVTAYGLFIEHYEKYEVIWNGKNGTDIFFQNEMPYDPPDRAAWMADPATKGYPAFLITVHDFPQHCRVRRNRPRGERHWQFIDGLEPRRPGGRHQLSLTTDPFAGRLPGQQICPASSVLEVS